jgi:hypothetical protein
MKKKVSRKMLQSVMATLAAAPLLSGIIGLSGIHNPLFSGGIPADLLLDTNLRFLNGMSIATALSFYFILPVIEKETFACRVICSAIFLGGIGRCISIYDLGLPPTPVLFFLILELIFPLLIIYWQSRLASENNG